VELAQHAGRHMALAARGLLDELGNDAGWRAGFRAGAGREGGEGLARLRPHDVQPGDPEGSPLFHRITLPPDDPEVMPADDDPLEYHEIMTIRTWIEEGAVMSSTGAPPADDVESASADEEDSTDAGDAGDAGDHGEGGGEGSSEDGQASAGDGDPFGIPPVADADADAARGVLARLRDRGISAGRIAQTTDGLDVNFSVMSRPATIDDVRLLDDVRVRVVWLDLSGAEVDGAMARAIARMPSLRRLHLDHSTIDDGTLAELAGVTKLEYLNLVGTRVTDASVDVIASMPLLERVYVWQTSMSAEGIEALRDARPDAEINAGGDRIARDH